MDIDLRHVPFSRYGSYFALSHLPPFGNRPEGLYLKTVHGAAPEREVFRVELFRAGQPVSFTEKATPTVLRLEAEAGFVELCFEGPTVIRARGQGVGLRLTVPSIRAFDNAFRLGEGPWQVNRWSARLVCVLVPLVGRLVVDAPWETVRCSRVLAEFEPDEKTGVFECAIEEVRTSWHGADYGASFDDCANSVDAEFTKWLKRSPKVSMAHAAAGEFAAAVAWLSVVGQEGHFGRPAMLMSKNWMTNVWSWDNCFNAMALTYKNPELAWDQFMLPFDCQAEDGALPDSINDAGLVWNFCKPPIQGWTLRWMMERSESLGRKELKEVYRPLARWTEWWLACRDSDGDGVPQYNHGNDSGWDNATVFDGGVPVEGPDLSAYLVVQMDCLAEIAGALDKKGEGKRWKKQADELLKRLFKHSWRGDRFVAPRSGDHAVSAGDSLLPYLPIVLGKRLPSEVRSAVVAGLTAENRFLTDNGLATESVSSPLYEPEGYWRGPIWAPSTLIIVDGLAASGERGLARRIASRFCDMVARSGMAENFDARSGAGLCDRAYTWTASVFQVLAHEYL